MVRLLVVILMLAHWIACGWMRIAVDSPSSWAALHELLPSADDI